MAASEGNTGSCKKVHKNTQGGKQQNEPENNHVIGGKIIILNTMNTKYRN